MEFKFKPGDYVRLSSGDNEGIVDKVESIEVFDQHYVYKLENTKESVMERFLKIANSPKHTFTCDKCGKVQEWTDDDPWGFAIQQSCWHINLGRPGYGSKLDTCQVKFKMCDDCVYELVKNLSDKAQKQIWGSSC